MGFLTGIRIVDFSWAGAGPFITLLCKFLGAEVIKVESMHRLDMSRYLYEQPPASGQMNLDASALFNEMNLGKRSVRLNLSKPKGIELAKKIIEISDILVENYSPGVMKKFGLDYLSLQNFKPDLIMVSHSLSGSAGPESSYTGYAPIAAALGGVAHLTGYADGPPSDIRAEFDMITGATATVALLAALCYREETGKGQYIDLSAREVSTWLIGESALNYAMNSRDESRCGNQDDVFAVNNCYRCRGEDTWISIVISTEDEWESFCRTIEHPEWLDDDRFGDSYMRYKNQQQLDQLIESWSVNYTDYEAMNILQRGGIAAVPSFNAEQLFTDPHLRERGFFQQVDHPVIGRADVISAPWKFSGSRPSVAAGPLLGQDSHYVFHDLLGMGDEEIRCLQEDKVIF